MENMQLRDKEIQRKKHTEDFKSEGNINRKEMQ